jgi:hypothetical protein
MQPIFAPDPPMGGARIVTTKFCRDAAFPPRTSEVLAPNQLLRSLEHEAPLSAADDMESKTKANNEAQIHTL